MVNWRNPLTEQEQKKWEQISVQSKSCGKIAGLFSPVNNSKATIVLGHPMGNEAKGYFLKNGILIYC
jgi:hypothetical protein